MITLITPALIRSMCGAATYLYLFSHDSGSQGYYRLPFRTGRSNQTFIHRMHAFSNDTAASNGTVFLSKSNESSTGECGYTRTDAAQITHILFSWEYHLLALSAAVRNRCEVHDSMRCTPEDDKEKVKNSLYIWVSATVSPLERFTCRYG